MAFRITFEQQTAKGTTRAAALNALLLEQTWGLQELAEQLWAWQDAVGMTRSSLASINAHLAHLVRRGRLIKGTNANGKAEYTVLS